MSRLQVPDRMLLHPIPAGGASGQALVKLSGADYAYAWGTISAGGAYLPLSGGTISGSLTVTGVTTLQDEGADTPSLINQGMTALGGRINIGGTGGVDRLAWIGLGINTPSTTLMPGSNQTLMYAEYWGNDAATGDIVGMDFGVIGPPSVKPSTITLFRLRGVGARTQMPDNARGLVVESINNGSVWNIGVQIAAPGSSATNKWGLINEGGTWLYQSVALGSPQRGSLYTVEGAIPGFDIISFSGGVQLGSAGGFAAQMSYNAWWDGNAFKRIGTEVAVTLQLTGGGLLLYGAPSAGASVAPAFAQIASIDMVGSLALAGNAAVAGKITGNHKLGYWNPSVAGQGVPTWSTFAIIGIAGTFYLPDGAGRAGEWVVVKNWSFTTIVLATQGGQVIGMPDGTTPTSISVLHGQSYMFISDGGAGMMVAARAV